ncbi:hypothetical protein GO491_10080 [Flavobacteriaceae bacterium Ap0902]|nr:hypothetical protein [Flavobacteriaceae bacterium Ap0902]
MKYFIRKIIYSALPILILLVGINYIGDAAKIFNKKYEKEISKIILDGNFVTNITNYDDRILQRELIKGMSQPPQLLILGSSRTMLINSSYFSNQNIFNNSVSGASMEDIVAILNIYKTYHHSYPSKIIIGIDPWLFNENNGQNRWKSIASFYEPRDRININSLYKYKQLLSLSYFQASLKTLPDVLAKNSRPLITKIKYNQTNTKLNDGSLVYGESFRNATQNDIDAKIDHFIIGNIYSLGNFNVISEKLWSEFESLVKNLKTSNVQVEFFLAPYPPKVYDKVSIDYPNVLKTESQIEEFAMNNKIKIYGTFNPYKLGFDNTYFYDGMHCKENGIREILNN